MTENNFNLTIKSTIIVGCNSMGSIWPRSKGFDPWSFQKTPIWPPEIFAEKLYFLNKWSIYAELVKSTQLH